MSTSTAIHIFKAGKHKALSGAVIEFTEDMLRETAAAYNPTLHEAPLVIGHPKLDGPAYGWAKSAEFADGNLTIEPDQVNAEFAEMVNAGAFKKKSAAFYPPDHPSNPVPGIFYIRHIGFLGAQAPAIKGLKDASFAGGDEGLVEFADWDQLTIVSLFRRFREWIISKDGVEEADKIFPNYEIESLQISAVQDTDKSISYSEQSPPGDEMSLEEKAQLAALLAENATLKSQMAAFSEREATAATQRLHADNVSFAEGLVKEGKLLPAHKDTTIALLDTLGAQSAPVEFGEGDAKKTTAALELYKTQLTTGPVLVEFSETAKADTKTVATAEFAGPSGLPVDAERLELHNKALEFAEANDVSYEVAIGKML